MTAHSNHQVRRIAIFTSLSWLGEYVHNLVDLPHLTLLSPENSIPALLSIVLFMAWWWLPYPRLTTGVLFVWAFFAQFLLGGIFTVLPLEFWPFDPPQTSLHYFMHLVYTLAQLPLIAALVWPLRNLLEANT